MNKIIVDGMNAGMSYDEYRTLIAELLEKDQTTGPNQSESFVHYTRLNETRMNRLDKKTRILPEIESMISKVDRNQTWLVITEAWCGDAAQIVPVINRLAMINPKIKVKHVLRDENEALINLFLTNGGKSIPIVIVIDDEKQEVLGHWGPRPEFIQKQVMARKNNPNATPYSEFVIEVQKWYARDKTKSIQKEFSEVLKN